MLLSQVHGLNLSCYPMPPTVNSQGIWNNHEHPVLSYPLPLIQLQFFLLFGVTEALYFIIRHFGLQKLAAQILAGIIMGPEVFGRLSDMWEVIFPKETGYINLGMGAFSFVLFTFTIGVRVDVGMALKSGKMTFFLGILAVLLPFAMGVLALDLLALHFSLAPKVKDNLIFLTASLSTTQFSDVIMILEDLKIINSELGRFCLSSAMVSALFSISISFISLVNKVSKDVSMVIGVAGGFLITGFVIFLNLVVRPGMYWIIRQTPGGRPVQGMYVYSILILALSGASFTNHLGHLTSFGALIVGLAVPDGPPLGSALIDKLDGFINGALLPFFVSSTMLTVGVRSSDGEVLASSITTCFVVWTTKIITCLVPPLYNKMPIKDAFVVAFILSNKGIAEVASYCLFLDSKNLKRETFMVLPFIALFSSIATSLLVKYLYDPARKYANYQKRNIMCNRNASNLKMLACVYKLEDSYNIIDFLDACNPTQDDSINVDVLHLIELVGRASPIFISHQLQTKAVSKHSYSEKVINYFDVYANMYTYSISINFFTAISPLRLMHEDICSLALNKQSALILLPFHIKWAMDGSIELEDSTKRSLNCSVLEKAPCSVGILIDCNSISSASKASRNVCMVFIGGNDDREALTLAKRTMGNSIINLTVLRLVTSNEHCKLNWSEMLDSEQLRDVKQKSSNGSKEVRYIEQLVSDGIQTSRTIQSIVSSYDLIIVGRSHDIDTPQVLGLMEWSEFPELGVIGDLLVASRDANMKALVLVVQQQITT